MSHTAHSQGTVDEIKLSRLDSPKISNYNYQMTLTTTRMVNLCLEILLSLLSAILHIDLIALTGPQRLGPSLALTNGILEEHTKSYLISVFSE